MAKFEERFAKTYGEGSLQALGAIRPYETISTGSLSLDYATGVGGLVEGRLHEFWGVDGVGKTTLALGCVAEAQRKHPDKLAGWIDMEHSLDRYWVEAHGIDPGTWRGFTPVSAEDVADAMKDMLRSGLFSISCSTRSGG